MVKNLKNEFFVVLFVGLQGTFATFSDFLFLILCA